MKVQYYTQLNLLSSIYTCHKFQTGMNYFNYRVVILLSVQYFDLFPEKSCGHPRIISNGKVNAMLLTYNNTIDYECNDGYRLEGNDTRYCSAEGKWDPPQAPTCVGETHIIISSLDARFFFCRQNESTLSHA